MGSPRQGDEAATTPHPGRGTMAITVLTDVADVNSIQMQPSKGLRSSQCSDTQEVHFIAKKTKTTTPSLPGPDASVSKHSPAGVPSSGQGLQTA